MRCRCCLKVQGPGYTKSQLLPQPYASRPVSHLMPQNDVMMLCSTSLVDDICIIACQISVLEP